MKLGVFDSGVGGLSVANAVRKAFPQVEVVYVNDAAHVPYGTKPLDLIYELARPKIAELVDAGCDLIIIACNTVTMTVLPRLRREFSVPFVGLYPMIKPAVATTKADKIIVCATPATLASRQYKRLKADYAAGSTVLEPDCSTWATLIEKNTLSEEVIRKAIEPGLSAGADTIVLACTHYHWIEEDIRAIAGDHVTILQPEAAVIRRVVALTGLEPQL